MLNLIAHLYEIPYATSDLQQILPDGERTVTLEKERILLFCMRTDLPGKRFTNCFYTNSCMVMGIEDFSHLNSITLLTLKKDVVDWLYLKLTLCQDQLCSSCEMEVKAKKELI
ncbi:hypothetical protein Tco_1507171 [Tanacetum coccineum]